MVDPSPDLLSETAPRRWTLFARRSLPLVLLGAVAFPSLLTWVYFVALADVSSSLQQAVYGVGKVIQFAFPVAWVAWILKDRIHFRPPSRGLLAGAAFGALIGLTVFALYYGWLKPHGHFEQAGAAVQEKVRQLGFNSPVKYVGLTIFYALGHSYLEEYYWRWFVFRLLLIRCSLSVAVWISSLGFMAHHVIVLGTYFGWASPVTYLFSAAVAIGGAVWAWLYARSGSLGGAWLSHLLVDASIFAIGYDIAAPTFT